MSKKTSIVLASIFATSLIASSAQASYEEARVIDFDTSLPADATRCSQTHVISKYLDSIAKDDLKKLTNLQQFLLSCQKLITESINTKKEQLQAITASRNS